MLRGSRTHPWECCWRQQNPSVGMLLGGSLHTHHARPSRLLCPSHPPPCLQDHIADPSNNFYVVYAPNNA